MAGAPKGNTNRANGKLFEQALKRALARRSEENCSAGLDLVADELVNNAINGEQWAVLAVRDTIDGKPAQSVVMGEDPEKPFNQPQGDRPKVSKDEWMKTHGIKETG